MNKTKPLDFSITSVFDTNEPFRTKNIFLIKEFGILYDMSHVNHELFRTKQSIELPNAFFFRFSQPYRLREGRIMLLLKGQVTIRYNLIKHIIKPSQILIAPTGSIVELIEVHPGTHLRMIGFSPVFIPSARKEEHIEYWGHKQNLIIPLSAREQDMADRYFRLIWEMVQTEDFLRKPVQHLIISFLHYISYIQRGYHSVINGSVTRRDELFNRFIALVNKHSVHERSVRFYAGKLCLTPRYLNTVIRQVSGQTVMEWINQAIIIEAKLLLKHDNLMIYQIADKLHFANPSFFCKFFKRMTGLTPQEYRIN